MHKLRWPSFKKTRDRRLEDLAGRPKPEACEICGESGTICFDHCHKSGGFRGWICKRCNSTLGHVQDQPNLLRALAEYLDKYYEFPTLTLKRHS